jgi:hypothetical protein
MATLLILALALAGKQPSPANQEWETIQILIPLHYSGPSRSHFTFMLEETPTKFQIPEIAKVGGLVTTEPPPAGTYYRAYFREILKPIIKKNKIFQPKGASGYLFLSSPLKDGARIYQPTYHGDVVVYIEGAQPKAYGLYSVKHKKKT